MSRICRIASGIFLLALPLHAQQQVESFQYQFPASSAVSVSRKSSIILRPGMLLDRQSVATPELLVVDGERSGFHSGRTLLSDDYQTVQFIPDVPFAPGEEVSVVLNPGLTTAAGDLVASRSFTFTTDRTADSVIATARIPLGWDPANGSNWNDTGGSTREIPPFGSAPGDLPKMTVTALDNPAPGRIYLSNLAFSATVETSPHLMIVDNAALPVFRFPLTHRAFDFKRQPNGTLTYFDDGLGYFIILDSNYKSIGTIGAGHGHTTDPHDLLLLPNGHAVLLALEPHTVDMSTIVPDGGISTVLDVVIQELDASQNVVFEWRSIDHFEITDATHEDLTSDAIDYVHPNSLEIDIDGNILMSSRHMDEVTKIDRQTGDIIWRMGGKHNEFTFINDPIGFSHQHDARRISNGNLMLFDNGNFHATPRSRVVEYRLDEPARTATLVWSYSHTPAVYSFAMGNAQRLPNGNTMIGWGAYPLVTEVHADGSTAFEMKLPAGVFSYRSFRLPPATSHVTVPLVSPSYGTTDLSSMTSLKWGATGGTEKYRVQVGTDTSFSTVVFDNAAVAGDSIEAGPLEEWTQYWWHVKAIGRDIEGVWSEPWTFYTRGTAIYQALIAPPQGTTEMPMAPTLHWNAYPSAEGYEVQLSNYDVTFQSPAIDTIVASQYLWLDPIFARSRYYWRVRPVVIGQSTNWSQVWDFQTSATLSPTLPEKVTPSAPLDHETLAPGDISFNWSMNDAGIVPTVFRVEVASDAGFKTVLIDSVLSDRLLPIARNVLPNGTYWWRVRATNAAGEQFGSPVFSFDVAATVGVDEPQATSGWSLYPNPATQKATLGFTLGRPEHVTIRLTDLLGRSVSVPFAGQLAAGENTVTIPTGDIPTGTYLCIVSTGGTTTVRRLDIAR
jgi:hypothetical protein